MSRTLDVATRALAGIDGFSSDEREVIVGLLKIGRVRAGPGEDGWPTPLTSLLDRAYTWSAFDRWQAFFAARGAFPARWDGLHMVPASGAPVETRVAYRRRKLDLLLEWLDVLGRQASEFGRYAKQGVRVRIVRQEDGQRCPVCENVNAQEARGGSDAMPPFHPGCRCVIMAMSHPRERSRVSS